MKNLRFKSYGTACNHLIELPNGKTILVDPFFYFNDRGQSSQDCAAALRSMEEIERVDYILLTHTHFDHEMNVGYFVDKFNAKVFVGAISAHEFVKFHKIPYDNLFLVTHGQEVILEDFTFYAYLAKHNGSGGKRYDETRNNAFKNTGISGHKVCDHFGSMESYDYLIVTKNNLSILFASGEIHNRYILKVCETLYPNIVFRQAGMREASGDFFSGKQVSPQRLAEVMGMYGAELIVPFHYDAMKHGMTDQELEEYFKEVSVHLSTLHPGSSFLYPKSNRWYNVGLQAQIEE